MSYNPLDPAPTQLVRRTRHAVSPYSAREADGGSHHSSHYASRQSYASSFCSDAEQVKIALAIADDALLRSLLVDCTPPLNHAHRIGAIQSTIGIRLDAQTVLDGVLEVEDVVCVLATPDATDDPTGCVPTWAVSYGRDLSRLTRCESDLQLLTHHATLVQAMGILTEVGFTSDQIQTILHLPYDAWYKSWWYTLDALGDFSVPFHRLIRTRRYADGTFMLQYKDLFPDEKPVCFKSRRQRVVVAIRGIHQSFSDVLTLINQGRASLGIDRALLIGDRFTDLEARGFINQGVSLYGTAPITLPPQADCWICDNQDCPMHGQPDSPVTTCRQFCVGDWEDEP